MIPKPSTLGFYVLGALALWLSRSYSRDLWTSRFVLWLIGAVILAAAAAAFAERIYLLFSHTRERPGVRLGLVRLLTGVVVLVFLYHYSGPVRGVWHAVARRVVTVGMARDLAPPPSR